MASSAYLTSTEGHAGKSVVAVGLLDQLARRAGQVGIFRPVVRDAVPQEAESGDRIVDLLVSRLPHEMRRHTAWGVSSDEMRADPDRAMSRVVERYHRIARHHDVVLIVGSDHPAEPTA